jgi:hypothetical protein
MRPPEEEIRRLVAEWIKPGDEARALEVAERVKNAVMTVLAPSSLPAEPTP